MSAKVQYRWYPSQPWNKDLIVKVKLLSETNEEWGAYCYHSGYGHNVYLRPVDLFRTEKQANEELERRKMASEAAFDAELESIMVKVYAAMEKASKP